MLRKLALGSCRQIFKMFHSLTVGAVSVDQVSVLVQQLTIHVIGNRGLVRQESYIRNSDTPSKDQIQGDTVAMGLFM